jgi:hypothetical protein
MIAPRQPIGLIDQLRAWRATRRALAKAQAAARQQEPLLVEVPRSVRLHQIADFAADAGCKLCLVGNGKRLRLVPRGPLAGERV